MELSVVVVSRGGNVGRLNSSLELHRGGMALVVQRSREPVAVLLLSFI